MSATESRALAIIARVSGRSIEQLRPELQLVADLEIDSPKALELICDLEEELGFELPDDAVDGMVSVGDVLAVAVAAVQSAPAEL